MEPIRTARGEAAALRAAATSVMLPSQTSKAAALLGSSLTELEEENLHRGRCDDGLRKCWKATAAPFAAALQWFKMRIGRPIGNVSHNAYDATLRQATRFLNGLRPYYCSVRFTGINFLVMCSTWYMFMDQLRLAFVPASFDFAMAIVNCVVWAILALELAGEVFIRPDGYKQTLLTEKAFSPGVVRHINKFHLAMEVLSLIFFVPEFLCLFTSNYSCSDRPGFSLLNASLMGVLGPDRDDAFYGRAFYAMIRLRMFGLVRHWKQMWISASIADPSLSRHDRGLIRGVILPQKARGAARGSAALKSLAKNSNRMKLEVDGHKVSRELDAAAKESQATEQKRQDKYLTNATNIGTALMLINSHRAMIILAAIVGLLPVFGTIQVNGGTNTISSSMTTQLQATNLIAPGSDDATCSFLKKSTFAWLTGTAGMKGSINADHIYVMWLQILPVRCDFQGDDGVVTQYFCSQVFRDTASMAKNEKLDNLCQVWGNTNVNSTIAELAQIAGIRPGEIESFTDEANGTGFSVTARFNESHSVHLANYASFLLQFLLLIFVLSGLSVLRVDAGRLVLGPLRRMLQIVSLYAKNPLAKAPTKAKSSTRRRSSRLSNDSETDISDEESLDHQGPEDQLGNYETEQLISAVTKITDLLRKCWGVAGAGIISSNLAREEDGLTAVFNPCVPGRLVYALFGFAAIKGFDHMLRSLGEDIMVLINDVAAVLHGEVYRWGFGDSGQCNKNLGAAFLMVYRIGDVKEVKEKRDRATDVIFDSVNTEKERAKPSSVIRRRKNRKAATFAASANAKLKKKVMKVPKAPRSESLALSSLPGINTFTDRAVLGMLKTYAGIYRDQNVLNWRDDFRLGAGVGAFSVDMIFGMDAGWAVEGAVGSEYKIDATYLSPHVNMASRMMSACKSFGVSNLISQAVQELLSEQARAKFRHLDTVTVKGSSVKQKIFTYDSRHKGVDFFLFERSAEDADLDAERYTPNIWNTDQDLKAMRQHVSDEFLDAFMKGRDLYLAGHWEQAIEYLRAADDIMFETIMDQGYMNEEMNEIRARMMDADDAEAEEAHLRNEMGDGPSRRLLAFIESHGGRPPANWQGFRPLTSK